MADTSINFEDFQISPDTGFMAVVPDSLPDYFLPWHELALKAIDLMEAKKLREEAEKLPQLDSSSLVDYRELRLAHLQLSIIAVSYVWQEGVGNGPQSLPANIAVPYCDVSDRLGVEAGNSSSSYLCNHRRIDPSKPVTRDNLRLRYKLPGGEMSDKFWCLTMETENTGWLVLALIEAVEALKSGDQPALLSGLRTITKWFDHLTNLTRIYSDFLEGDAFVRDFLPFYSGFHEHSGYPDGLLFEGVTNNPRRKTLSVTAAQGPHFQCVEALLGVEYSPDKSATKERWRQAWSHGHRRFYQWILEAPVRVKDIAKETPQSELAQVYNDVLRAMDDFRTYHIQVNTRYVVGPIGKARASLPEGDTSPNPVAKLIPSLKSFREDVNKHRIVS